MIDVSDESKRDYRSLQGVEHIEAAFLRLQDIDTPTSLQRVPWVAAQCVELIYFNAAELFDRVDEIPDTAGDYFTQYVRLMGWLSELLDLALSFSAFACSDLPERDAEGDVTRASSPALRRFDTAYRNAEQKMLVRLRRDSANFSGAVATGGLHDALAMSIQHLKNAFHTNEMVLRNLTDFHAAFPSGESALASDALEAAVFGRPIKTEGFLTQFRLLHQIPELCGLIIVDLMMESGTDLEEEVGEPEICERLFAVRNLLSLLTQCNRPLRTLMIPSEYYKIRHLFGTTSGAASVTLSKNMLRKTYLNLASAVKARLDSSPHPEIALIAREMRTIGRMITEWRMSHLSFPRNLLGGFQTASLAGTADGLDTAKGMMLRFQQKDPFASAEAGDHGSGLPGAELDRTLLWITADATQARYQNVQTRAQRGPMRRGRSRSTG